MKGSQIFNTLLSAVLTVSLTAPAFAQSAPDNSTNGSQMSSAQDEQAFMAQNDLHEVALSNAGLKKVQKVDDVVTAVAWLGRKIGHGTKVAAKFTYKHVLKPIGKDTLTALKDADKGTVFVAVQIEKGTVTVTRAVVKGSEIAYEDAIDPLIVTPLLHIGKIALVDGAYGLIIYPTGQFFKGAAQTDLVTGAEDFGRAEAKDGAKLGADTVTDAGIDGEAYYQIVIYPLYNDALKPAGEAVADGTLDTGLAIGWLACEYANSFRDNPKTCKFQFANVGN